MSTRRRVIGALRWLALAPALLALAPVAAQAADFRQGQSVTIPAGTTVTDDLYVGAGTVTVDGTVDGSLIAAGGDVRVSGTVERDVMVTGGTVTISGPVHGSVRMAGGTMTLSGQVTDDVVAAGGNLDVSSAATIGRDLVVGGGTATVSGGVGRDLTAGVGTLDLRGRVERNVRAEVTNLHLQSGASVGGNLDYASDNTAQIDSGATVSGTVTHSPATFTRQPTLAERVTGAFVAWVRLVVGLFALGLVVVLLFGAFSRRASDAIGREPLPSLGLGLAVMVGAPIAALIVFVLGLLVGGWPLGIAVLALLAIAVAIGYVLSALFVGQNGFRLVRLPGVHPLLALLAGLIVLTAAGLIPFVGWLIALAAVVFGLGALTLTLFRYWRGGAPAAASAQGVRTAPDTPLPG